MMGRLGIGTISWCGRERFGNQSFSVHIISSLHMKGCSPEQPEFAVSGGQCSRTAEKLEPKKFSVV
jgi:hypothetical protein